MRTRPAAGTALWPTDDGGWLERAGLRHYFLYDSNSRLIAAFDSHSNALYFHYDGSAHYQYLLSQETGRAVYFADGRERPDHVSEGLGRAGRRRSLTTRNGRMNKVVGPSLCVTYFDYSAAGDLHKLTDSEGRVVYYDYNATHRIVKEKYASYSTSFSYGLGVYTPDCPNSDAWYGRDTSPPNNLSTWQDNHYTDAQKTTVSTDDSNYCRYCNQSPPPSWQYAGHEYLLEIFENRSDVTRIDVKAKVHVYQGGLYHKLYIWNFNSTSWTQLDAESPWSVPRDSRTSAR